MRTFFQKTFHHRDTEITEVFSLCPLCLCGENAAYSSCVRSRFVSARRFFSSSRRRFWLLEMRVGDGIAQQFFHPGQSAVAVGELAALGLRRHAQHAEFVDASGQTLPDARLAVVRQRQRIDVDFDRDPRLHLVDVLPARTAGA
jgi:hypothetical protein